MELPCAPGRFNSLLGLGDSTCPMCPAGAFQPDFGASSCLPCSSSSVSNAGDSLCSCLGLNRVFQATDGYCVCAPGHEFVDDAFIKRSEEDGVQACQPIVYTYCVSGQIRAADGSCITAGECAKCPDGTGTLIPRTGLCECSGLPTLEDVCNAECRRAAPVVSVDPSGNGSLVIAQTDIVTGVIERVTIPLASLIGLVGTVSCSSPIALAASLVSTTIAVGPGGIPLDASAALSGCRLVTLSTSSGGIGGTYDLAGPLLDAVLSQQLARRRLGADETHASEISRMLRLYYAWKQKHQAPLAAAHAAVNRNRHLIVVRATVSCFDVTFAVTFMWFSSIVRLPERLPFVRFTAPSALIVS